MLKITQQYVGDPTRLTYGDENDCYGIVVHETANKQDGATAQAHANLQSRYGVGGSWHAQSDDLGTIESYQDKWQCWHAGDGRREGNLRNLSVEICVNLDESEEKQVEAYKSAAYWVATKMVKHSIPLSRVKQHHDYSPWKKDCPDLLRAGKYWTWNDFLAAVAAYVMAIKAGEVIDSIQPKPPVVEPKPKPKNNTDGGDLDVDGWWGKNVTYDLQAAMGTPRDKVVSKQNDKWETRNPGLTSGWEWVDPQDAVGSQLIGAMQDWMGDDYKGRRDRLVGPEFFKGLQRKLGGLKDAKGIPYYTGSIDGELWTESRTIKGLQRALNDGKIKR